MSRRKQRRVKNQGSRKLARNRWLELLEDRRLLTAIVTTNQADYAPGSTALFTAASDGGATHNFSPGETIQFHVTRADGAAITSPAVETWNVKDGVGGFTPYQDAGGMWYFPDLDGKANGTAETHWGVDWQFAGASLSLTATGLTSHETATTAFTDSVSTPTMIGSASSAFGSGSTLAITVPAAGVAAGNTVIVTAVLSNNTGTMSATDTRGNAYSKDVDVNGNSTRTVVFSAPVNTALTSGNTITITFPGSNLIRVASAFWVSGLVSASPVDKTSATTGSSSSPSSGLTATTTQANELVIGAIGTRSNTTTLGSLPTGFSALTSSSINGGTEGLSATVFPMYRIVSATGTYAASGTLSASRSWAADVVTYKAALPSTTTTVSLTNGTNPSIYGASLTFHAAVSGTGGTPTGTVQFKLDGVNLGSPVTLSSGAADLTTSALTAIAGHQITAVYSGDSSFSGSTSAILTQDVQKRSLTVTATGVNRVYNGTTAATVTLSDNRVSGDALTVSYSSAAFADKNAGTGKTVNVSGIAMSGTASSNYTLGNTAATTTADITQKGLTVSGLTAGNKTYDTFTTATLNTGSAALVGVVTGDTVALDTSSASGAFATKTAGNSKPVTVTGLALTGGDAGNYSFTAPTPTANITAAPLTVSGVTAQPKTYDRTTAATIDTSGASLVGVLGTDDVTLNPSGASGAFTDKNVATGKTVNVSGMTITGGDAGNYSLTQPTATADITARDLTVTAAGVNRTYDGTNIATVNLSDSRINGDSLTLSYGGAVFDNKNAGTGKSVSVSNISVGGADFGNYNVLNTTATTTADIAPKALTLPTASAANRTYNATDVVALSGVALQAGEAAGAGTTADGNWYSSDDISLAGTAAGAFGSKNIGNSKPVTISGLSLTGGDAGNYSLALPSLTANVTTAELTVSGVTADNKFYDGTTAATLNTSSAALVGVFQGDLVSLNTAGAHGVFSDATVGTGKTVIISGLTISGTDAGNYSLTQPTATADIQGRNLTVSFTADSRTYDGTTGVVVHLSDNHVAGDSFTVTYTGASFDTKNAGTGKTVTLEGIEISGPDAYKYVLTSHTATNTANIAPKALTFPTAAAISRAYNASTLVALTGMDLQTAEGTLTGTTSDGKPYVGDDLTLAPAVGNFASKNIGNNKAVTISGVGLTGVDAGNYSLTLPSLSANVTAAPLSISGVTAQNKTYDRTTAATLNVGTAALVGVFEGDTVTLNTSGATGVFPDKNVATGKTVTISGFTISGLDVGNYTLSQPSATADITARDLTVSATATSRTYDGTAGVVVTLSDNRVLNDSLTASFTGASFDNKNAGTGKTVTASGISISGADAGNYALVSTTATATANIAQKALTFPTAAATSRAYNATTGVALSGMGLQTAEPTGTGTTSDGKPYSSDDLTLAPAVGNFATKNIGTSKAVILSGLDLTGADAANYTLTLPSLSANVTAAGLTVSGVTADNKTYDGTTAATLNTTSAAVVGVFSGDTVSLNTSGASGVFTNAAVGTGKTVIISGIAISGTDAGNYSLTQPTAIADITAGRNLTVTVTADSRTYDGTTGAVVHFSDNRVAGDSITISYTGAYFDTKDFGTGKTVTVEGISISGPDADKYTLVNTTATTTANIAQKTLTVSGLTASNKTYDATTAATLNVGSAALVGIVGSETVTLDTTSASGSFANKNVGTAKAVTVTGLALAGADMGNYTLAAPAPTANITAATLTVTGVTANSKVYDGATTATITTGGATLSGVLGSDVVTLSGTGTGAFADKNVGTGKTVTVAGLGLAGADAGNYTLAPTTATANITAKALTVVGVGASGKVYDGTTTAAINTGGASLVGVLGADAGNVILNTGGAVGNFTDRNAGTNKTGTASGLTLSGPAAGNYTLTPPSLVTTVNAPVGVGVYAANYVLASSSTMTLTGSVSVGDTLIVSFASDVATAGTIIVSDSKGNTYTLDADVTNSSGERLAVFSSRITTALTTGNTVVISHPATWAVAVSAFKVTGLMSATSPRDQVKTATGNSTTPSTGNAGALAQNNELVIGVVGTNNAPTFTVGSGYTALPSTTSNFISQCGVFPEYRIVYSGGTYSAAGTLSASGQWAAALVTYKADTLNITQRPISVSAVTNSKAYDGTTSALAVPTVTGMSPILGAGDIAAYSEVYTNPNVGTGKILTPVVTIVDDQGNDVRSNYAITTVNTTGVITVAGTTTVLTSSQSPSAAGAPITLTATVAPIPPATGTPTGTVTFKDGTTTLGTGTVSNGVATLTTSALTLAGVHSLTAVYSGDTNLGGSQSTTLSQTITPAATSQLVYTQQPTTAATGVAISPAIVVQLQDQYGNLATSDNSTVTLAIGINPSNATLGGPASVIAVNGVATFGDLTISKAGAGYTLTATGGGFSATSTAFVVNNPAPAITSLGTTAGNRLQTLDVPITGSGFVSGVTAVSFGSDITVNSVTVSDSAHLTANITIDAVAFTGARDVSVSNAAPGGGSANLPLAFSVDNPAPTATSLTVTAGTRQQTLVVPIVGANFINGVTTVTFGPDITVNSVTVTDSSHLTANITIGVGAVAGLRDVSVINPAPGGGTATFTSAFTVNAFEAVATKLVFGVEPTNAIAGRAIAPAVTVLVEDEFGNVVATDASSVHIVIFTNPSGGVLSGVTTTAAVNGVATFNSLVLDKGGTGYTLAASDGTLTGATSTSFDVSQLTSSTSVASSLNPTTFGQSVTFTATVSPAPGGGTVTFYDGSTVLATQVQVDSQTGQATFTTTALSANFDQPHAITAVFSGYITYAASTSAPVSQLVNQKAQTITFTKPADTTFSPPGTVTLTATSDSGLPVVYSIISGKATVTGNVITLTGAGTVVVAADQAGNADFAPAPQVQKSFAVAKGTATIHITAYNVTYDGNPHTATGTATGVGGVDLASLLVLTGTTHTNANSYPSDTWSFAGNADYNSSSGAITDVIGKASVTVTVVGGNFNWDGQPHGYVSCTVTGPGGLNTTANSFSYKGTGTTVYGPSATAPSAVGNYQVTAVYTGDANHSAGQGTAAIAIGLAPTVVSISAPDAAYDGAAHGATATVTGNGLNQSLTVTYTGRNTTTYGPTTTAPINVGDYIASASYAGDSTHGASSNTANYSITKGIQTITFSPAPPTTANFGDAPITLHPLSSSGLAVTLSLQSGPASLAGNVLTINGPGDIVINADQAGNTNWNAATRVQITISVAKGAANVTLNALSLNATYNGSAHAIIATTTAPGTSSFTYTYNGSTTAPTNAGSYSVVATLVNANYQGSASGTLVIAPDAVTITPTVGQSKIYGDADPTFTYSGTLIGTDAFTGALSRITGETVHGGPYPFTLGTLSAGSNYTLSLAVASPTFAITAKAASVTPAASSKQFGQSDPALTGTLSGFLTADGVTATYTRTAGETVAGSPYTISAILSPAGVLSNYNITYNTASFVITTAAGQTITFNPPATATYGDAPIALSATASSGLPVSFSLISGPATLLGSTLTITGAGDIVVAADQAGDANHGPAPEVQKTISVAKATANVTLDNLSPTYNGSTWSAGATTNAGGTSSFTYTYNGSTTAPTNAGSYTVVATLVNANYQGSATGTMVIAPAAVTITPDGSQSKVYGNADPTFTFSGALIGSDTFTGALSRAAGETVTGGPYAFTLGTLSAGSNYTLSLSLTSPTFAITARPASVTPTTFGKLYGASDPVFTGTLSGFLPADNVTATYSRAPGESVSGSPYAISATLSPSGVLSNYNITYNTANFTISKASQSITFSPPAGATYGDAPITLTASATSGLPVTFSLVSGPATLNGNVLTITGVGNIIIAADQAGDTNYDPATEVQQTLSVAKGTATVTLDSLSPTYNGSAWSAGATTSATGTSTFTYTYNGSTTAPTNAGSYTVVATLVNTNYQGSATGTMVIAPDSVTITPNANQSKVYGDADPAFTFTGSLIGTDTFSGALSRASGETVTGGPYAFTLGSLSAGSNYVLSLSASSPTFAVTARPASVTPAASSKQFGDPDPVFTGTTSGFLAVDGVTATYSRTAGESVSGSPYTISATLSPSGVLSNYNVTYNTANFVITTAAGQTITFSPPATATYGDAPITLSASATSGLPVTFSLISGPATLVNNVLTITGVGDIVVAADQPGDSNYGPAPEVQKTISVAKATANVTLDSLSPTYNGSAWSAGATTSATGTSTFTYTYNGSTTAPTNAGSYTVVATLVNTNYQGSATGTMVIAPDAVTITPNANQSKVYGDVDPAFTFTGSLIGSDTFSGALSRAPGETVTGGPYAFTLGSLSAGSNYVLSLSASSPTFAVTARPASVTPAASSKQFGDADPVFTGTTSGFLPADGVTATYGRTAGESVSGSPYTISATLSPSGVLSNYNITYNTANFVITSAAGQTITFSPPATATYGDAPITLSAGATSGLPVSFSLISGPATLNGDILTITGVGDIVIAADQAGDSNYGPAPEVQKTISVGKASVSVGVTGGAFDYDGAGHSAQGSTVTGAGGLNTTATSFTYTGTGGTSYGPSATPPTVAGSYSVVAHYAGDSNHTAGDSAPVALVINPAAITINGTDANDTITINRSGSNIAVSIANNAGTTNYTYDAASIAGFVHVFGLGGLDTCIVDSTGGAIGVGVTFDGGTETDTWRFVGGTQSFSADVSASAENLELTGGAAATFSVSQHPAGLVIGAGSSATLAAGGGLALVTSSLSIDPTGRLNANDSAIILRGAASAGQWTAGGYSGIAGLVATGFNGYAWNGPGINSGTAGGDTTYNHGLAVMSAAQAIANGHANTAGAFDVNGETVSGSDVVVKQVPNGDLNLDGQLNYLDYGVIDNAYLGHAAPSPSAGDLNLDGVINYIDYGMMDNAFLAMNAPHAAGAMAAAAAAPAVVVPGASLFSTSTLAAKPASDASSVLTTVDPSVL